MAARESYREKQENELEVLRSIFNQEDVIDLRPSNKSDKWYPLDLKIKLEPQRGSAFSQAYCYCFLRIKAPKNYPKVPPKLSIEDSKGLSNADITKLLTQLNKEAYGLKGEVCIFELCQFVQAFLHERNHPPKGSFYDEMLAMKLKKDEEEKKVQAEKEQKWNQQYADEVTKRKEQLKKEQRTRRSTINDSPMRHLSSEGSNSECQMFDICEEHKRSETLLIPLEGKKILQGACLGHSIKGCINYSGIDYSSGKLYYITEWTIRNSLLEARNLEASDFIENVEKKVQMLMKLKHQNIVNYEGVVCNKRKDSVQVVLIQEFILGISVCSMSGSCFNWNTESISSMTKGILEGLIFLHNNGVSHDNLTDSAVFLDSSGVIKISDYSIIPYIQEILNGTPFTLDLPSLGSLIESLIPTPHALEMRNFINECKSERTLSASSLLEHPFLYNIPISSEVQAQSETKAVTSHPPPALQVATIAPITAVVSTHSRLKSEFEIIKEIGQGAYGKVLKVRNNLDNRFYAIKKIPLTGLNKQLYRKVRREVELLSRLNHENVVRYYSSWTEQEIDSIEEEEESDEEDGFYESSNRNYNKSSLIRSPPQRDRINDDDIFDAGWNVYLSDSSSDSDDYDDDIEFVDSQGRIAQHEDDESGSDGGTKNNGNKPVAKRKEVLYIQMEFCEKLTLRSAIDNGMLGDKGHIWKLFREIVEGLTHLHQQGMIHRDLKCDNIFLDSKDHVKIGDFGLATTNILALQNQNAEASQALHLPKISYSDSQTGLVGTALYCAPELSQVASKSIYNQKVDLYSLGIIFFEMCMPKFQTGMERNQVLQDLRKPEIIFPKMMMDDEFKRERQVISWLLNHNPLARPTSEELLQSDLMPPAKVEASEIQEMFRHVLANPQSRNYKNLINRIMQQENDDIVNSAYHTNMYFISAVFENVKIIIEQIFRKHGALDVSTPLLTPYHKSDSDSLVRLMTHSGSIVTLPMDLRQTFLRMIAQNIQINWLRRYAIGRTYRERKAHNQHPKQTYECVFDIVTPIRGHSLVDAELMAIVHEIISNFEVLKQRNICIKINHTSLVRAIFLYYSVPTSVYKNILALIKDYYDNAKISKKQLTLSVISLLPARNRPTVSALIDTLLLTDVPISNLSSTNLKVIIKGRGDATTLAKGALRELETVISLTQAMGVTFPINICVSLTMGFDCSRGSIIWNVSGETKSGKSTILCYGGRFDYQLEDYQKSCHKLRELYCAGFTLAMDKLIACLNPSNEYHSAVDLVVFISGNRPPLKDVCQIMKSLWTSNIKCCFIESHDDDDIAKSLGANHIIVLGEDGCIRIKSWLNDRYQEKSVSRGEAIDYLKKNLSADFYVGSQQDMNNLMRNNSVSSITNDISTTGLPSYDIVFIANEKYNASKRKRLENQIEQKFEKVLHKFSRKETFIIFAIELDGHQIRAFLSCIDPNSKDQSQSEFDAVLKSFPKNKQNHLQEVYDEITDRLSNNKSSIIYGIFGIPDSYCRLIL